MFEHFKKLKSYYKGIPKSIFLKLKNHVRNFKWTNSENRQNFQKLPPKSKQ
jgi:hypothetical protein